MTARADARAQLSELGQKDTLSQIAVSSAAIWETSLAIDITSFIQATSRLREGLARYHRDLADEQIRDGLIQRFEFTYELSHKMLKRFLEQTVASPDELDQMDFATLIRSGSERGLLLGNWPEWKQYRGQRARSSHTYAESVALEVVAIIPAFLAEAEFLCDEIRRRQS